MHCIYLVVVLRTLSCRDTKDFWPANISDFAGCIDENGTAYVWGPLLRQSLGSTASEVDRPEPVQVNRYSVKSAQKPQNVHTANLGPQSLRTAQIHVHPICSEVHGVGDIHARKSILNLCGALL